MVRNYQRKTSRGTTPSDIIEKAVNEAVTGEKSIRAVAEQYNMCHVTLTRYIKKKKQLSAPEPLSCSSSKSVDDICYGYTEYKIQQVFTEKQEDQLADYIKQSAPRGIDDNSTAGFDTLGEPINVSVFPDTLHSDADPGCSHWPDNAGDNPPSTSSPAVAVNPASFIKVESEDGERIVVPLTTARQRTPTPGADPGCSHWPDNAGHNLPSTSSPVVAVNPASFIKVGSEDGERILVPLTTARQRTPTPGAVLVTPATTNRKRKMPETPAMLYTDNSDLVDDWLKCKIEESKVMKKYYEQKTQKIELELEKLKKGQNN